MEYSYVGTDRNGRRVTGKISAESENEAKVRLHILGTTVSIIKTGKSDASNESLLKKDAKGNFQFELFKQGVKPGEIAVFTKQLSVMIDSGISIVQALAMLALQTPNPTLSKALDEVRTRVEKGQEFSAALATQPDIFDSLFVALIEAGTAAGQLDVMLKRLSIYIEKSAKLKKQLISALTYPAIVLSVAGGMTALMLLFVVPMLAKNFTENGKELPALTQIVIDISVIFQNNFLYIVGLCIAAFFGFKHWKKTPAGKYAFDKFQLKMPIFGGVVSKICLARFASTMSTLTASGISIVEALTVCAKAAGNAVIETEVERIKQDVIKGKGLSSPMGKSPWFPPMVVSMVSIGEGTGRLDALLEKVSMFYEDEVDSSIAAALKLIEPVMFVVIGAIVGVILIAMYLPVFDLAGAVTG